MLLSQNHPSKTIKTKSALAKLEEAFKFFSTSKFCFIVFEIWINFYKKGCYREKQILLKKRCLNAQVWVIYSSRNFIMNLKAYH